MSFLSDLLDYEKFNVGRLFSTIEDDPERLFLGAMTPVGTELWGGILGEDWESPLTILGGNPESAFREAEAEGIDTGAARTVGGIADAISSAYAGNYFGGQLDSFFGEGGSNLLNLFGSNGTGERVPRAGPRETNYANLIGRLNSLVSQQQMINPLEEIITPQGVRY